MASSARVLAQVILLARRRRIGVDDGRVAHKVRLVLRRLAGEEAVEIFEAVAGRPILERAGGGGVIGRRVVPLAPGRGGVAVVLQHLGDGRARLRDDAGIAVPVVRELGDLPVADAVMVASGQQRRAGRRAHRGGVEAVEGDAALVDAVERRRVDLAAIGARQRRPDIVEEHDEDVRRIGRKSTHRGTRAVDQFLHRSGWRCCPTAWAGRAGPPAPPPNPEAPRPKQRPLRSVRCR